MTAGHDFLKMQLAMLWFLDIIKVGLSWKKSKGGFEYDWVGYHILLLSFRLGLSESRAAWVIKWTSLMLKERHCWPGEFGEALGRLGFVVEALEYEKPFLAPLYKFASLHAGRARVKLPLFVLMILAWIKARVTRRRTCPCRERRVHLGQAIRVDARAEGQEVGIGGWAPVQAEDGTIDKWRSPWFMVRLTRESAPWAFSKGEPYRAIMALELFATTVAVALLGPNFLAPCPAQGSIVFPALADNLGSTYVVVRGVSSKFPLCLVTMELAARLEVFSARLDSAWVPRHLNQEADALSNFDDGGFNPELRVGTLEVDSVPLIVLPHMMKVAAEFYKDSAREGLKRSVLQSSRGSRKKMKLRDRDPW